ncbi:MAG: YceD family protein [Burkholderiaceae bacterium]
MSKRSSSRGPRAQPGGPDPAAGRSSGAAAAARPLIDTSEFCRLAQSIEGATPVARLPRLAADLFDDAGQVDWRLRGWQAPNDEAGVDRRMRLELAVQCAVRCDRCLQRLPIAYEVERDYLLMRTEKQAAEVDADVDDYDVLVASPRFDVLELVEDEAIMGQPLQAEHEDCELPVELDDEEPLERPNPFAALASLRRSADDDAEGEASEEGEEGEQREERARGDGEGGDAH